MNTAASDADEPDEGEPRGNDGISLSGGPVTNTGAIVAGGDNRVTVRRTGAARAARGAAPGHPLTSTGALVGGSGHEVDVEDTGDIEPADAQPLGEPGEGSRGQAPEGERPEPGGP
ncbi:hypothetical protein [Embleya scabrispora]|uniref:hypothetical protein n=1 Tax=Embleya scabrispora TaxID=159449 RepID=UPI00036F93B8|nr:hypothetical protein [Embleya scabrispora]MYS81729.1 hypothetical protein [Streptomyces sp. SID5474]